MPEREHRATVCERLVNSEVEALSALFHPRSVERAGTGLGAEAPTGRALPCRAVDALLEEKQLYAPVGGSLERLRPARSGAGVPPGLLAPALDRLVLLP